MLDDILKANLTVVFCGTAVGNRSATLGQYYAGSNNRFWRVLAETGLTPRELMPNETPLLLEFGIGLTDLAKGQRGNDTDLSFNLTDCEILRNKIMEYSPRYLVFNGKRAATE